MSFLKAYFKRGTNYDCDQISQLLYRFDTTWGHDFEEFVEKNSAVREGISSCYAVRNSVAHGGGQSLGPRTLLQYYETLLQAMASDPNRHIADIAAPALGESFRRPPDATVETSRPYVAPRNDDEIKLAEIWQKTLSITRRKKSYLLLMAELMSLKKCSSRL